MRSGSRQEAWTTRRARLMACISCAGGFGMPCSDSSCNENREDTIRLLFFVVLTSCAFGITEEGGRPRTIMRSISAWGSHDTCTLYLRAQETETESATQTPRKRARCSVSSAVMMRSGSCGRHMHVAYCDEHA